MVVCQSPIGQISGCIPTRKRKCCIFLLMILRVVQSPQCSLGANGFRNTQLYFIGLSSLLSTPFMVCLRPLNAFTYCILLFASFWSHIKSGSEAIGDRSSTGRDAVGSVMHGERTVWRLQTGNVVDQGA